MGSFDCYCALCAGPLGIYSIDFGSAEPKALRKRWKRLELHKRRLAGEDVHEDAKEHWQDEEMEDAPGDLDEEEQQFEDIDNTWDESFEGSNYVPSSLSESQSEDSDSDYSMSSDVLPGEIADVPVRPMTPEPEPDDSWSVASDLTIEESWNPYEDRYGKEHDLNAYEEKHSYDPTKLRLEDTQWLNRCRGLGFNSKATSISKAFFSGRGRYDDYGSFDVRKPGTDPNDSGERHLTAYWSYESDGDETCAFPFHEACFEVLARALGHKNYKGVDKDVMYGVMSNFVPSYARCLELPYGTVQTMGQFWECLPGEEVCWSNMPNSNAILINKW